MLHETNEFQAIRYRHEAVTRTGAFRRWASSRLSPRTQRCLTMQGFTHTGSRDMAHVAPWLRVVGGATAIWALASTVLGSAAGFAALALLGAVCAVTATHPFDLPYQLVIRRILHRPPLPRTGIPRRFGCGFSGLWAAGAALSLSNGLATLGTILGLIMVLSAGTTALTHFCLPSWIWRQFERLRAVSRVSGRRS